MRSQGTHDVLKCSLPTQRTALRAGKVQSSPRRPVAPQHHLAPHRSRKVGSQEAQDLLLCLLPAQPTAVLAGVGQISSRTVSSQCCPPRPRSGWVKRQGIYDVLVCSLPNTAYPGRRERRKGGGGGGEGTACMCTPSS